MLDEHSDIPIALIFPCLFPFISTCFGDVGRGWKADGLLLQLLQRLRCLLDGRLPIRAVNVIQVKILHAEPLQALLDGLSGVLGGGINHKLELPFLIGPAAEGELGGEENVLAALGVEGKPLAEEFFAVSVHVGRVPVCAADGPSMVEEGKAR